MPFWSTEIQTMLPPDEVARRLRRLLRAKEGFWKSLINSFDRSTEKPPFRGEVLDRTFTIERAIGYKNSFLPVVRGRIDQQMDGGSTVRLRMTLSVFATAFIMIWFGGLTWAYFTSTNGAEFSTMVFWMMLAAMAMILVGFVPEARKAERLIRNALTR